MVIPLGDRFTQSVWLVTKKDGKLDKQELKPTLFVPMTGRAKEAPTRRAARSKTACRKIRDPNDKGRRSDQPFGRRGAVVRGLTHRLGRVVLAFARPGRSERDSAGQRSAQEELIVRPGPPPLTTWKPTPTTTACPTDGTTQVTRSWMAEGGSDRAAFRSVRAKAAGPACGSQPCVRHRRQANRGDRARACWVRQNNIQIGDREGTEPRFVIDFLGRSEWGRRAAARAASSGPGRIRSGRPGRGSSSGSRFRRVPKTRSCRSGSWAPPELWTSTA